jgi:POT family proton-dependent oligopeptide transporter
LAVAIGMKSAGMFGELSESISKEKGLSYFFWMLTILPIGLGVISLLLRPFIKKLMHGVK